jgi:hypothetical protein
VKKLLLALSLLLVLPLTTTGQGRTTRVRRGATLPSVCDPGKGDIFFRTSVDVGLHDCPTANSWRFLGNLTGAPAGATYITKVPEAGLSAEQAISNLASGILRGATTTGIITVLVDSAGLAANLDDEVGNAGGFWRGALTTPAVDDVLCVIGISPTVLGNCELVNVSKWYVDGASCPGATATNNWDDAGTGDTAPTAACNDTGSIQRPSADFAGGAVNSFERTFRLPSDWDSSENVDVSIRYVTVAASPTGNVEWDISTVCRAVGESWDGSFNTIQTITDAVGSQNALNDATQTAVTMTGCAAGEDWTLKISRDGTSDSNNDLSKKLGVMITLRRS